jgi:hypothetical protein
MASSEQAIKTLEECAQRFYACPRARLRTRVLQAFFGAAAVLLVLALSPLGGLLRLSPFAILGTVLAAAGSYFVVSGAAERTHLFTRLSALATGASLRDWLTGIGTLLLLVVVLWLLGVLWLWLTVLALAVAAAVAFHVYLDRPIARCRAEPLAEARQAIKLLRQSGHTDAEIHALVAERARPHWEEFFEALFGYEAKLAARRQWGLAEDGRPRKRFRAWRDPLLAWIDEKLRIRQAVKERRYFQEVEERALRAEGHSAEEARRQAIDAARTMVCRAAALRETTAAPAVPEAPPQGPERLDEAFESARKAAALERRSWREAAGEIVYWVFAFFLGQRMRLLLGCVLLVGCALWASQNGLLRQPEAEDWSRAVETLSELGSAIQGEQPGGVMAVLDQLAAERRYPPLELQYVPSKATAIFNSFNPGVAGMVLVLSALAAGLKISVFMFPAVTVMLFAHTTGIPGLIEPAGNSITSLAIGLVLVLAGYIWGRE